MRRVVFVLGLIAVLAGCQHTPPEYQSHYTPSSSTSTPRPAAAAVAVIGDSYTGGTGIGGEGPDGWPALVAARLRQQGIDIAPFVAAQPGSDYATPGANGGGTFSDQIPKVVRKDDRLVIVFGSDGDPEVPPDQLQPAVRQTLDAIHSAAPAAKVVVIGPARATADPTPGILQTRDVIRTEAEATGATFIDPLAAGWFVNRPDLTAPDGSVPTNAGHVYMADQIAPIVAKQLQ